LKLLPARPAINEKANSIKKELVDVTTRANNLLNAIMTGLDSEMAREKLKELENQKQALNETLRTLDRSTNKEIDRTALIAELGKDAEVLMSSDGGTREVVQKYVSQIILSDTTVEITGMSDKYVSSDDCGGTECPLFTLWFVEKSNRRVLSLAT